MVFHEQGTETEDVNPACIEGQQGFSCPEERRKASVLPGSLSLLVELA